MTEMTKVERFSGLPDRGTEMASVLLRVGGMDCPHCPGNVEEALRKLDGVSVAHVNLANRSAHVVYDPSRVNALDLVKAIRAADANGNQGVHVGRAVLEPVPHADEGARRVPVRLPDGHVPRPAGGRIVESEDCMPTHDHAQHEPSAGPEGSFWTSQTFLVCAAFLVIGLILLWTEHLAHALGVLPYLLILACPLMHMFMHGGHGGHAGHAHHSRTDRDRSPADGGKP
jgi:copper chaperone CopZ